MTESLKHSQFQEHIEYFDREANKICLEWSKNSISANKNIFDSVSYSFSTGGKRFRPLLCLLLADLYAAGPRRVIPWAMAVEMIHTYSLIHDDLPCMDNDDFRRGQPTNHRIYGESTALLAGDALLTEAFLHLASQFKNEPELGITLVSLLSEAAGLRGMVGGQVIDINFQNQKFNTEREALEVLEKLHQMKTGALIQVAVEGTATVCGLDRPMIESWRQFGAKLGLAFQIKDDILDAIDKVEPHSYPGLLGKEASERYLHEITEEMLLSLNKHGFQNSSLSHLVMMNLQREK